MWDEICRMLLILQCGGKPSCLKIGTFGSNPLTRKEFLMPIKMYSVSADYGNFGVTTFRDTLREVAELATKWNDGTGSVTIEGYEISDEEIAMMDEAEKNAQ
jgi:hypothetical protein